MRYRVARVVVVDDRLYTGNGLVHRWVRQVSTRAWRYSVEEAPKRSGELAAGIYLSTRREGRRQVAGIIGSSAPHSDYVLFGTASQGRNYIYSTEGYANRAQIGRISRRVSRRGAEDRSGWYMALRSGVGPKYALRVHGQRANNFLIKGYNRAARTSRALRPMNSVIRLR